MKYIILPESALSMKDMDKIQFQISPTCTFQMLPITGDNFQMGSNERDWEQPIHKVQVPSFHMSQYQVTQFLYEAVIGENPSRFKGKRRPVERVSWHDAKTFLTKLNELDAVKKALREQGLENYHFRLPSESEWEYAAKGGKYSQGYTYAGSDVLEQVGWFNKNSNGETKRVGLLQPNELGLHDMSGNVYEWCEDDWHRSYSNAPADGSAWLEAADRAAYRGLRGGNCFISAVRCRPAYRHPDRAGNRDYYVGFRIVLSPS